MDDLVLSVGVIHRLLARGAPPARLERGAAGGMPQRLAAAGAARTPVREQPQRTPELAP